MSPDRTSSQIVTREIPKSTDKFLLHQAIKPITYNFLMDCIATQAYLKLDARRRNLLGLHFGTSLNVSDLASLTGKSVDSVRGSMISAMATMWQELDPELQKQYQPEETFVLKRKLFRNRNRNLKQTHESKPQNIKTEIIETTVVQPDWQDPDFDTETHATKRKAPSPEAREHMSQGQKRRRAMEYARVVPSFSPNTT